MLEATQAIIATAVEELFGLKVTPHVSVPEEQFGDVATNVAMQLAKQVGRNPREVAEQLVGALSEHPNFTEVSVAGPGFINFTLSDESLVSALHTQLPQTLAGKTVVAEYSDPNPFKVLHLGHLYTSVIGSAISNLFEASGATVHRVNFGGDVGLHVANAMWGIIQQLGGEHPEKLSEVPKEERAVWLSQRYVEGTAAYESADEAVMQKIINFNKRIYSLHEQNDTESPFAEIYHTCREWSYDYFNAFYDRIGTPFEKYYPESVTAPTGFQAVKRELANGVYEESDGAVIFDGEKYGLHKRVFINSEGLPTYEAKDVGLAICKWQDYQFDRSVMITGNDILQYMQVVMKSIEQFEPQIVERSTHVTHGMVKLKGGVKMSSRKGNILKAVDILDMVQTALGEGSDESVMLAAVKYSFLKQSIGQDVMFDIDESVATHGNSGPYLQYAHARARSILSKAGGEDGFTSISNLLPGERRLARKLANFQEAFARSLEELAPHHLCTYLYELAQVFNKFYEDNQVIGDERQPTRVKLVATYADVLQMGLSILGIDAPHKI